MRQVKRGKNKSTIVKDQTHRHDNNNILVFASISTFIRNKKPAQRYKNKKPKFKQNIKSTKQTKVSPKQFPKQQKQKTKPKIK